MVCDTIHYINKTLRETNKQVLVEGANATMLDIDFGKHLKDLFMGEIFMKFQHKVDLQMVT